MADESQDPRLAVYLPYRSHLLDCLKSGYEQYDKAILTLSSGGLGLSIAFIKDVVKPEHTTHFCLLIVSWALFAGAILSTVLSYFTHEKSFRVQLENADLYFFQGKQEYLNKENPWTSFTRFFNILSGLFFSAAVVLTVIFASFNIGKTEVKMAQEKTTPPGLVTEGAKPAAMPLVDFGPKPGGGGKPPQMPAVPLPTPPPPPPKKQ